MKTIIGVDLGQTNDYTAIVVLEQDLPDQKDATKGEKLPDALRVVHLERHRHKPYTEIAEHVIALTRALKARGSTELVVDGAGVGRPVVDMLKAVMPFRVVVHGGQNVTSENGQHNVPKKDLIGALHVAYLTGVLRVAEGLELGPLLAEEVLNFKAKITTTGHTQFAADWRENDHDDLAFALGMAVWWAQRPLPFLLIPVYHSRQQF